MDALERKYVLAVAREQSFSRAAEKLYVTQPALSAYIIKLEKAIGCKLFDRSCSPIALTDAGRAYADCARRIGDLETELENHLNDLADLRAGQLAVGGANFYCTCLLPPVLAAFSARYPGVRLSLAEDNFPNLLRMLAQGSIDCVVDYMPDDPAEFALTPLREERILLAAPERCACNQALEESRLRPADIAAGRHLSENCPRVDLALFRQEDFLFLNSEHSLYAIGSRLCRDAGFRPRAVMYLDQLLTSYALTLAGQGVSFISDTVVQYGVFARAPALYAIDSAQARRQSVLIQKKNRYVSKALEAFTRMLKDAIL